MRFVKIFFLTFFGILIFFGFIFPALFGVHNNRKTVKIGYFPNIAHAQAMIARNQGFLEKEFGALADVDWKVFNAGPAAVEAVFAGYLDIAYLGPSPAINGYIKSEGQALKVIAGSAQGGSALVVRKDAGIRKDKDFSGKKIASPQVGNTQDVALRSWLQSRDLDISETGNRKDQTRVMAISNADIQTLWVKNEIDGAWTVEPWVSFLVHQFGGKVYLDEAKLWPKGKYPTVVVVARKEFLENNKELVRRFLRVHLSLTQWIHYHPDQAQVIVADEIKKETGKMLPGHILKEAWKKISFDVDPMSLAIGKQAMDAYMLGYLKTKPDLSKMFDLKLLDELRDSGKV